MNEIWNSLVEHSATYVPNLLAAVAVLAGGWIAALLLSALVRNLLGRAVVDKKLANWISGTDGKPVPIEKWAARGVFWLIMLLVLIAFFQTMQLSTVTEPLQNLLGAFVNYIPRLIACILLLLLALLVATVVRRLVIAALKATKLDSRLATATSQEAPPQDSAAKSIADTVYWIVLLAFLPAILGALGMDALLEPVNTMMAKFFAFLPNMVGAGLTLLVGWIVARIVQKLASNLLASVGVDRLAERWGFDKALGPRRLSDVLGLVLHLVILVPVLIAALDQLQMAAITRPASDMLQAVLLKLPQILAATLILLVAWFIARVLRGLLENLLGGLGFNQVLVRTGVARQMPEGPRAPAAVAGVLLMIGIMLVAAIAAAETLEYTRIADIVRQFLQFAGQVLLGVLLFGLGLMLAQVVFNALRVSDSPRARVLSWFARIAIIVLVGAMSLRATGVADSIVNLAFGALVCGLAAAGAIAFGLGGRKFAADQLAKWKSTTSETGKRGE